MGRPRKYNKGLPAYVRIVNGSYLYKHKKLCRVSDGEARMYELLAQRKATLPAATVPVAVATYKLDPELTRLTPAVRKEHGRLLHIFAEDFADWRVDEIGAVDIKKNIKHHYSAHPSAASHYKSRLSSFFRWCVADEGFIKVNRCDNVRLQKVVAKKTPWTPALF